MRETVLRSDSGQEFFTSENCYILECSNLPEDPAVSLARARVKPGAVTRWHRLRGIVERYYILSGRGRVEIGDLEPQEVSPGDVVLIPPGCRQRIANPGAEDLLFLCVCSPRFVPEAYEELE